MSKAESSNVDHVYCISSIMVISIAVRIASCFVLCFKIGEQRCSVYVMYFVRILVFVILM